MVVCLWECSRCQKDLGLFHLKLYRGGKQGLKFIMRTRGVPQRPMQGHFGFFFCII